MRRISSHPYWRFAFAIVLAGALAATSTWAAASHRLCAPDDSGPPNEDFHAPTVPDYRHAPIPGRDYPASAIQQHHEGTTQLMVTLDSDGHVVDANISQSSGYRELDGAAIKTIQSAPFPACTPTVKSHRQCIVFVPVVFHMPKP